MLGNPVENKQFFHKTRGIVIVVIRHLESYRRIGADKRIKILRKFFFLFYYTLYLVFVLFRVGFEHTESHEQRRAFIMHVNRLGTVKRHTEKSVPAARRL